MIRRIGRPGLVGTAARTAVIAGTATAVTHGMSKRANEKAQAQAMQQQQAQAPPPAPPPPAPAEGSGDTVAELQRLADLKAQGLLTDEEFAAAKAKLLA